MTDPDSDLPRIPGIDIQMPGEFVPFDQSMEIDSANAPDQLEEKYSRYAMSADLVRVSLLEVTNQPPPEYLGNNEFFCDPLTSDYDGVIIVNGMDMPDGWGTLYREDVRGLTSRAVVRGAQVVNPAQGFVVFDTEAPFNSPVIYLLKYKPTTRFVSYNYVGNPSFEESINWWRAGDMRVLTRVEVGQGAAPAGTSIGEFTRKSGTSLPGDLSSAAGRLLGHTNLILDSWTTGKQYRIGGRVLVRPGDQSLWSEARSDPATSDPSMTAPPAFNWAQLRADNIDWKDVVFEDAQVPILPQLYVGLVNVVDSTPASASIITLAQVAVDGVANAVITPGGWHEFSVTITLPEVIPGLPDPNIDLAFYHGSTAAEYDALWALDAIIMDDVTGRRRLSYFDGSTEIPADQPGIGYSRTNQTDLFYWDSGDATAVWEGTPHLSRSKFTAASEVAAYTSWCRMDIHEDSVNGMSLCEPVYFSDPIIPSYSMWIGLLSIAPLERAARRELLVVYGRHAPIALSEKRASVNTTLTVMTNTLNEREALIRIINSGRIIMMRNPDSRYPETQWYMSLGDVSEERILPDHRDPRRRWKIDVQLVDRPSGSIASIDGQTWAEAKSTYPTWKNLKDENAYWMTLIIGRMVTVATNDMSQILATEQDPGLYPTAKAARWSAV